MEFLKTAVRRNERLQYSMYLIPTHEIECLRCVLDENGVGFIEAMTKHDSEWAPTIAALDGTKGWKEVLKEQIIEL